MYFSFLGCYIPGRKSAGAQSVTTARSVVVFSARHVPRKEAAVQTELNMESVEKNLPYIEAIKVEHVFFN